MIKEGLPFDIGEIFETMGLCVCRGMVRAGVAGKGEVVCLSLMFGFSRISTSLPSVL